MKRLLLGVALAAGSVLGPVPRAAAEIPNDTVKYWDPATKKNVEMEGKIEDESPAGIKIVPRREKFPRIIPALDVVHVVYRSSKLTTLEYRQPFSKEERAVEKGVKPEKRMTPAKRAAMLDDALRLYRGVEGQMTGSPWGRRYVQYRIALCLILLGEGDPAKRDAGVKALKAFKDDNPGSWEVVPALQKLAAMQQDKGDTAAAQKSYEELADLAGAPPELRLMGNLEVVRLLLRGRKFDDATRRLETAEKSLKEGDPNKVKVDVYLSQCRIEQGKLDGVEPRLRAALRAVGDKELKALAHNTLGDYYLRKGQKEDAFWEYLKTDLLFNEDKEEQAKALYRLAKLFDEVKHDLQRAEQCRERLKTFTGTTYQRLAAAEAETSGGGKK